MASFIDRIEGRRPATINALVVLFALDSIVRAMATFIIPLHAYRVWHAFDPSAADSLVGAIFTAAGVFSFLASFFAPRLIRLYGSRKVFLAALGLSAASLVVLSTDAVAGLVAGMAGRTLSLSMESICLTLFIADNIDKKSLVRLETRRRFYCTFTWGAGPILGAALYAHFGVAAPALLAAGVHLVLMFYVRGLDLADNRGEGFDDTFNPIALARRFLAQKRLRLAWILGFGRCMWWSMFFTYPTIYLVEQGMNARWAGWLIGFGNILTVISPLVGAAAGRWGVRPLIIASFILAGSLTLGAAFAYGVPLAAAIFLLLGATFVSVLDCLYNVPFMRFVRRRERPQMTTVYSTYSDMADILLSALYGLLLMSFDFRAVFATAGIVALAIGLAAIRLPRGL